MQEAAAAESHLVRKTLGSFLSSVPEALRTDFAKSAKRYFCDARINSISSMRVRVRRRSLRTLCNRMRSQIPIRTCMILSRRSARGTHREKNDLPGRKIGAALPFAILSEGAAFVCLIDIVNQCHALRFRLCFFRGQHGHRFRAALRCQRLAPHVFRTAFRGGDQSVEVPLFTQARSKDDPGRDQRQAI